MQSLRLRHLVPLLAIAVLALPACDTDATTGPDAFAPAPSFSRDDGGANPWLKVMTWNAYFGGDTGPLFSLDFNDLPAVLAATQTFWADVQASDVPGRAAAIADEIAARRPHVIALQEVVQLAVVDLTTGQIVGGSDILANIQGQLAARGLGYELVATQANTSSALPLAFDFVTLQPTQVLAFTDRVAVLRRSDVVLSGQDQGQFQADLDLGPLTVKRGWIRASFDWNGAPHHVVATHLETQSLAPIQIAQVDELLAGVMAGLEGVQMLVGDLNSDAAAGPGDPSWTPTYERLLEEGFVDGWLEGRQRPQDPGFTCCQEPDLMNGPSLLDERIDFVLVRATWDAHNGGKIPGASTLDIVGEEQADRTESGLWPADHAGLAVRLRVPKGRAKDEN